MKKGQVYEGIVERIDFPNKGVVSVGEDTCIVKNSLPGQKVKFVVNKSRKGKAEGRLLEVMEASPLEMAPPCSHFGVCGGCLYLSLPYEEQLKIKEAQVKGLLDKVLLDKGLSGKALSDKALSDKELSDKALSDKGAADNGQPGTSYQWEGIKGSPQVYEYRNKMEFSFGDEWKDGPLSLGMHKRGGFYDIVNVKDCRIVDQDFRIILEEVQEYFKTRQVTFFHRLRHVGYLRHLLVRKASGTGEILVGLVTSSQNPWGEEKTDATREKELLEDFCSMLLGMEKEGRLKGRYAGIIHIINDSIGDVVKSDRTDILYGKDYFYEELLGLKFKISAFSFFQTNTYGAEVLYELAREYVGDISSGDKVVFDLYSGTGTIAQLMAQVWGKVIGVEIVEEAVEAARENARLNGLSNCKFMAGDVLKVLDEIEEKPDVIILDPPRDGVHPKALPKILAYGVERIVYISCKPTSLARDLSLFLEKGYVVEKAAAVDQFCWTGNVETVVQLTRKTPDSHSNVKVEFGEES